jgi:hypothetical protein
LRSEVIKVLQQYHSLTPEFDTKSRFLPCHFNKLNVNAGRNFLTLAGLIFPHPWGFWAVSPAQVFEEALH